MARPSTERWEAETAEGRAAYQKWLRRGAIKLTPHIMVNRKRLAWCVCSNCGLVSFNNPATRKTMRAGCEK